MNNSDYNKAEKAVNETENSLKNAASDAKWKIGDLAGKARDYINESGMVTSRLPRKIGWKK